MINSTFDKGGGEILKVKKKKNRCTFLLIDCNTLRYQQVEVLYRDKVDGFKQQGSNDPNSVNFFPLKGTNQNPSYVENVTVGRQSLSVTVSH